MLLDYIREVKAKAPQKIPFVVIALFIIAFLGILSVFPLGK